MRRSDLVLLMVAMIAAPARADDLTIVSWGGAYETAQNQAVIAPFAAETGLDVEVVVYDGSWTALAERGVPEGWDVIDMLADQARVACAQGLLLKTDPGALFAPEALADFTPFAPNGCAVPQNAYARVMAFDDRAFSGVKPTRIEDFFDTDRFPGPRAVQRSPDGILEWALLAEGVPRNRSMACSAPTAACAWPSESSTPSATTSSGGRTRRHRPRCWRTAAP